MSVEGNRPDAWYRPGDPQPYGVEQPQWQAPTPPPGPATGQPQWPAPTPPAGQPTAQPPQPWSQPNSQQPPAPVMPSAVAQPSPAAPQPAPPKRPGAVSTGQATLLVWAIGMQICVIVGLGVIYVGNMEPTRPSYGYGSTEDSSAGLVIVVLSILLPIVIFMVVIGRRIYSRYSE